MSSQGKLKNPTPPSDQRYLPRWEVRNRVTCQIEQQNRIFDAETKDLSCSGVCITTSEVIRFDQRLKLTVYLSRNKSVSISGKVVWIIPGPFQNLVGIQFYNTTEDDRALILDHAFELNRSELVKHWFRGWEGAT